MTANYKIDSASEIRKFLWDQLIEYNIFDQDDYYSDNLGMSIEAILPVQQQPELNQFFSGKKHIIYDKIGMTYNDNWLICDEQISFCIYATEIDDINEIRNFMIDTFRRMDEAARDVNQSSRLSNKIKFHSIYIADISPISPSEELKGFLSADVILDVQYSRITDGLGRFL